MEINKNFRQEIFHPIVYYIFKNIIQNPMLQVATLIVSKTTLFYLKSITPPIAEIICVKNVGAIVVCGFLMK